jgi:hypothetical protein
VFWEGVKFVEEQNWDVRYNIEMKETFDTVWEKDDERQIIHDFDDDEKLVKKCAIQSGIQTLDCRVIKTADFCNCRRTAMIFAEGRSSGHLRQQKKTRCG